MLNYSLFPSVHQQLNRVQIPREMYLGFIYSYLITISCYSSRTNNKTLIFRLINLPGLGHGGDGGDIDDDDDVRVRKYIILSRSELLRQCVYDNNIIFYITLYHYYYYYYYSTYIYTREVYKDGRSNCCDATAEENRSVLAQIISYTLHSCSH